MQRPKRQRLQVTSPRKQLRTLQKAKLPRNLPNPKHSHTMRRQRHKLRPQRLRQLQLLHIKLSIQRPTRRPGSTYHLRIRPIFQPHNNKAKTNLHRNLPRPYSHLQRRKKRRSPHHHTSQKPRITQLQRYKPMQSTKHQQRTYSMHTTPHQRTQRLRQPTQEPTSLTNNQKLRKPSRSHKPYNRQTYNNQRHHRKTIRPRHNHQQKQTPNTKSNKPNYNQTTHQSSPQTKTNLGNATHLFQAQQPSHLSNSNHNRPLSQLSPTRPLSRNNRPSPTNTIKIHPIPPITMLTSETIQQKPSSALTPSIRQHHTNHRLPSTIPTANRMRRRTTQKSNLNAPFPQHHRQPQKSSTQAKRMRPQPRIRLLKGILTSPNTSHSQRRNLKAMLQQPNRSSSPTNHSPNTFRLNNTSPTNIRRPYLHNRLSTQRTINSSGQRHIKQLNLTTPPGITTKAN